MTVYPRPEDPEPSYRFVVNGTTPGIECLFCHRISYHPGDIANIYCGHCRRFHEPWPHPLPGSRSPR